MSVQQRREREHAEQRRLILSSARTLAETEGWSAVTTRRLAEQIEYSQPVLYKHFESKDGIVRAVALAGFGELTAALRAARAGADSPDSALRALCKAYTDFAVANPSLYEAMFTMSIDLVFGRPDSPDDLVEAFTELREAVAATAYGRDVDTLAELIWGALHGLVMLGRSGRLRPTHEEQRLTMFVDQFLISPGAREPA